MSIITTACRALLVIVAVLALGAAASDQALAQSAYNPAFDHYSTGWPLEGSHRGVDCAGCHVGGVFQGTPRQCVACHSLAGLVKATPPPVNHIRTTDECDACHRETSWSYVRPVDHTAVIGTCFSCHNGQTATGKPPAHVPTSSDCDACHRTRAWVPTN
jgi:Cytochrome c7 and related cytochrome c